MIPHICSVKHDPPHTYGDCVRTSIASLMSIHDPMTVPHFIHDGCSGDEMFARMRAYLRSKNTDCFICAFPGEISRDEILEYMQAMNPEINYLLFGATATGDHVVIARGDKVIHDTGWYPSPLIRGSSSGVWQILVLVDSRVI